MPAWLVAPYKLCTFVAPIGDNGDVAVVADRRLADYLARLRYGDIYYNPALVCSSEKMVSGRQAASEFVNWRKISIIERVRVRLSLRVNNCLAF